MVICRVNVKKIEYHNRKYSALQYSLLISTLLYITTNTSTTNTSTTNTNKSMEPCLFATDLIIYTGDKNMQQIKTLLQLAIHKLQQWTNNTDFQFSKTKTKAIHFCKK